MNVQCLTEKAVHTGELILVNQQLPYIEDDTASSLTPACETYPNVLLERETGNRLSRLMDRLGGWSQIVPVSGWRSLKEQQNLYAESLRENGPDFTRQFVALPGHSEHQTGFAVDLGLSGPDLDLIRPEFPYSGVCQEFRMQAANYGFIERYPSGKEEITGIAHEPWHFRYVGRPHAEIMADRGFTLEEYHDFLKQFPVGAQPLCWRAGKTEYSIFYQEASREGETRIEWGEGTACRLSGDNASGFIVTQWRLAGS